MKKRDHFVFFGMLLLLAGVAVWLIRSPTVAKPYSGSTSFGGETMGTTYQVQLAGVVLSDLEKAALQAEVDAELVAVNEAMSTYIAESEISRFNRMAVGERLMIGPRFREVLARSLEVYLQTQGAFDPTLGPLIDLWGFGAAGEINTAPTAEEIRAVRLKMGMEDGWALAADGLEKTREGLEMNLSAIAKGYGVDRVAALLLAKGYENIYVEIGGELSCLGRNPNGIPWRIGIQVPELGGQTAAMKVVALEDQALATSGDYRNYVADADGLRHHILDPRSGRPARHTLASVSVLAADCMTADAVATALFVMGTEEGMAWLADQSGLEALFIDRDGEAYRTSGTPGFMRKVIAIP